MKTSVNNAAIPVAPTRPPVVLSYRYSVSVKSKQHIALDDIFFHQWQLFNGCIRDRKNQNAWVKRLERDRRVSPERLEAARLERKKGASYIGQSLQLTEIRKLCPEYAAVPVSISRGTIQRVAVAYAGAFARHKKNPAKPGYPGFRRRDDFNTIEANDKKGWGVKDGRLRIGGVPGTLRLFMHRPLPCKPDAFKLTRRVLGVKKVKGKLVKRYAYRVSLACKVEAAFPRSGRPGVGVDAGVKVLAATSDGELYTLPKQQKAADNRARRAARKCSRSIEAVRTQVKDELRDELRHKGRKLADREWKKEVKKRTAVALRGVRGYRNRRGVRAKFSGRARDIRDYNQHAIANAVVGRAGLVAVENLSPKGMMAKGGVRKRGLNRGIGEAGMSALIGKLEYKAARAGVEFVKVRAAGTSQECSGCGYTPPVKKLLSQRVHRCAKCGLVLDRDINAARNILARAAGKES